MSIPAIRFDEGTDRASVDQNRHAPKRAGNAPPTARPQLPEPARRSRHPDPQPCTARRPRCHDRRHPHPVPHHSRSEPSVSWGVTAAELRVRNPGSGDNRCVAALDPARNDQSHPPGPARSTARPAAVGPVLAPGIRLALFPCDYTLHQAIGVGSSESRIGTRARSAEIPGGLTKTAHGHHIGPGLE